MKKEREINVFSISFIDVFCCALGAMILIFVINSQYLTNTVKSSVEKYRQKADEAKKEKDLAQKAREEANNSKQDAIKSRNIAENAEKDALRSKMIAEKAHAKAIEESLKAQQALIEVEKTKSSIELAMEQLIKSKQQSDLSNRELLEKNNLLKRTNDTLEKLTKQKEVQNKELAALMARYEELKEREEKTDELRKKYEDSVQKLTLENNRLREEVSSSKQEKDLAVNQLDKINSSSKTTLDENESLTKRLSNKEDTLRKIEKQIEEREKEISLKEEKISSLEEKLQKKGDKSLFGIKLNYHRIAFLLDKSGSIFSNNWKEVIISTCEEILQHCEVDEFSIIAFSSDMKFFPARKGVMASGDKKSKDEAGNWLRKQLRFGGSTYVHEALEIAYQDYGKLDAIFLLTDGLPYTQNISSTELQEQILEFIKKQKDGGSKTKIITVAIGYPPLKDGEKNDTQYADIYKYLHKISELTDGQYLGR